LVYLGIASISDLFSLLLLYIWTSDMNDPNLIGPLTWSIVNSDGTRKDPKRPPPELTQEMVDSLFRPTSAKPLSSAELMQYNMAAIKYPEITLEDKLTAFNNFLDFVAPLDGANNLDPLGLWGPLTEELSNPEPKLRGKAAECVSTAVQNNFKTQEKAHSLGLVPTLADMALNDSSKMVRKMAISALSSSIHNFQPGFEAAWGSLPSEYRFGDKPDASDITQVQEVISALRTTLGPVSSPSDW